MNQQRLTAAFFAVLLFLCGVGVGMLASRYYTMTTVNAVNARNPDAFRQRYINDLRSKLHLTPEQVSKLEGIMDHTRARYRAAHDAMRPEMAAIRQEHIRAVKAILTPQQVPEYDRLMAEHEHHDHPSR